MGVNRRWRVVLWTIGIKIIYTTHSVVVCSHNICFYIQADECLDDQTIPNLRIQLDKYKDDPEVEGLLFDYTHFFGSYNYIGNPNIVYTGQNNQTLRNSFNQIGRGKNFDRSGFTNPAMVRDINLFSSVKNSV